MSDGLSPDSTHPSSPDETSDIEAARDRLIARVEGISDPAVLLRLQLALDAAIEVTPSDELDELLARILRGDGDDEPLRIGIERSETTAALRFETRMAPWGLVLGCLSFVVAGLYLLFGPYTEVAIPDVLWRVLNGATVAIMLLLALELIVHTWLLRRDGIRPRRGYFARRVVMVLLPPLRPTLRDLEHGELVWLPRWRWSKVNHQLFVRLQRCFSTPMVVVALLIVPLLLIGMDEPLEAISPSFPGGTEALLAALKAGDALIWAAFALEFTLMVSIAEDRAEYCKRSWLDILIIALPLVAFFRSARVLRVLRLNQLARGYRLKGVLLKVRQALVIADAVQRLLVRDPERRVAAIAKKIKHNRRERADLQAQAMAVVERVRLARAERAARRGT